jgi:hypothetical protein
LSKNAIKYFHILQLPGRLWFTWFFVFSITTECFLAFGQAPKKEKLVKPLSVDKNGKLVYEPDSLGNRIPDFSYCGYMAGELPIPDVPVKVTVAAIEGDATARIQAALDFVGNLPAGSSGIRGAVLLAPGKHTVTGRLKINASGVILRGSGMGDGGTVLIASGTDRETLITVAGKNDRVTSKEIKIQNSYVPVNATKFLIEQPNSLKKGDRILIHRPSTAEWIKALKADHFGGGITSLGWKPGQRDLYWDRTILNIQNNEVTIDAPITTALDINYGGGTISAYRWNGQINQVGVENLRVKSSYDTKNPKDEDHSWMGITFENVKDSWVRQVVFEHFAGSAVAIFETGNRITVEDCQSLSPISEIGGQRRNSFFTNGQQTLFQRNYAEFGFHDFAVGFCAPGPNAFVQCESHLPFSYSGATDSWASGILFDIVNVTGQALSFKNLGQDGQGAGWNAANSVFWQCSASRIDCYLPPTANNWSFGSWAQFSGDGYWDESNNHIKPRSLYYAQLKERIGEHAMERAHLLPVETEATSSPTIEQAAILTAEASQPVLLLRDWISQSFKRQRISSKATGIKSIDEISYKVIDKHEKAEPLQIVNGLILRGNGLITGKRQDVTWWSGSSRPYGLQKAKYHITRFVPGRKGKGLTDDLKEVTDSMRVKNIVGLEHNYGLWYERRRDDHERIKRMDGDVWPPFYELPFARSGKDTAWDGLSKYDLNRYNAWYWDRLKQFANLADEKGLLLVHQNYFQHNILEAGAHYADFPWRTANNINETGFPEPPPYAGDKRIFIAEQFYDITNPVRKGIHKAYIRKCLDNFVGNNGVIQLIGAEFTGPLEFVQFWIDTIIEWEKETGKEALIGLSTTKDVQDAILSDPVRSEAIDIIDLRYWHIQNDGNIYAPEGGKNLAPRQFARILKPKKGNFEETYRSIKEYRERYPEKAVIYSVDGNNEAGWATLMAGGSLPSIPKVVQEEFLNNISDMQPNNAIDQPQCWGLINKNKEQIIYSNAPAPIKVDLSGSSSRMHLQWIDPENGTLIGKADKIKGGRIVELSKPREGAIVLWIKRNK